MGVRRPVWIVAVCAVLVGAAMFSLRWTADRVEDLDLNPRPPAEAGEPLDPGDVAWLASAPERTRVDPVALRSALDRLRDRLASVLVVDSLEPPIAILTRVEVPAGWAESDDVGVLTGAEQRGTVTGPEDRCGFLSEVAASLARAGWTLRVERHDAIQTEYPLISPGPVDLAVSGTSSLGRVLLGAPASGGYAIHLEVDESTLARAAEAGAVPPPTDPVQVRCP